LRILVSWLRDFVDVETGDFAAIQALANLLSMRGFEVAAIEAVPPGDLAPPGSASSRDTDAVIDLEITPNRPDCLSVLGIAREVATAYGLPLRHPKGVPVSSPSRNAPRWGRAEGHSPDGPLDVIIYDPDLCPRYAAAIAEVRVGPSPAWLANRLVAAGVRPIHNVVDVTNYVLMELGHPTHAFDLDRLESGRLEIRRARAGELLTTLDGEKRTLEEGMLIIADAARPQALAGVMGGADSEVSWGTRRVALESAWFDPVSVRRTSRKLGLKSEASARFERGADIGAPVAALARFGVLIEQLGAGRLIGGAIDCYPSPRAATRIRLRRARITRVIGQAVADAEVSRILAGLGFDTQPSVEGWMVAAPTARVDVSREEDLIEEVARHHGYDVLPATFPPLVAPARPLDAAIERDRRVRKVMTAAGFSEAITFAFVEASAAAPFSRHGDPVPIAYPLSEKFAVLRPSLLPGLLDAVGHNVRRERKDVSLFEIGARFSSEKGERRAVAMVWTGAAAPDHWSFKPRPADFYDIKGVVERLSIAMRIEPRFRPAHEPYMAEGHGAFVICDGQAYGVVGQLAPALADRWDLPSRDAVFVAELDLELMQRLASHGKLRVAPLPRFPSVVRDISVLVDEALPAAAVRGTIRSAASETLVLVREFDRYKGKGIPEGHVSLSLRLTFQSPERTLTDAEVQEAMDAVMTALVREHHAKQR
jgi:phenylalanyl-tRNA synthetase beta chain